MSGSLALPLYTVEEYFSLVDGGRLDADAKVELLEGVIVEVPTQTPRHAVTLGLVERALRDVVPGSIRTQVPFIASSVSSPDPDLVVVAGEILDYAEHHPTEALLVVEVSLTSLAVDRLSKSRIYAGAGVPEYWIVNLQDHVLEVHRAPNIESRVFEEMAVLSPGQTVTPLAAPVSSIKVSDLLPLPIRASD